MDKLPTMDDASRADLSARMAQSSADAIRARERRRSPENRRRPFNKRRLLGFATFAVVLMVAALVPAVVIKEVRAIPGRYEINEEAVFPARLGHYDLRQKRKYQQTTVDSNGVPVVTKNGATHYHPVRISQFALGAYEHHLDHGDAAAKAAFLRCAAWLRDNLKPHGPFSFWEYTFAHPGIETIPWFSAMAQGQGASVLLRAFLLTGDQTYLKRARDAIQPIFHDLSEGGVSVVFGDDYIFPQEYPSKPPPSVLNGAIAAYFGVHDYYMVTGDLEVKKRADIIVRTFARSLHAYDAGYWSLYSLSPPHLAKGHYQAVHVAQLRRLYLITRDDRFLAYSHRFEADQNDVVRRTRYVITNHLRQLREMTIEDAQKIPGYVLGVLTQ